MQARSPGPNQGGDPAAAFSAIRPGWAVAASETCTRGSLRPHPPAGPSSLADTATALAGAQSAVRDLSARDLVARALELRDQAAADHDDRTMICAMSALSTAHRSAGNRDEWLRWREAIRCQADGRPFPSDLGHPDWDAQRALGAALGYAAAPFAAPRNWAAFVLVGRG